MRTNNAIVARKGAQANPALARWSVPAKVGEALLETEAHHMGADGALEQFADAEAIREQHLRLAWAEMRAVASASLDGKARRFITDALDHLERARVWDAIADTHAAKAHTHVRKARTNNRAALAVVEAARIAALGGAV